MTLSAPVLWLESPHFLICQRHVWSPPLKHQQDEKKDLGGRGNMHQQSVFTGVFYRVFLLLFLGIPLLCLFSLLGCWPSAEQEAFSSAVTATADRVAVTHLFPILATWIGSVFLWCFFLYAYQAFWLETVKKIILKIKKIKSKISSAINQKDRKGKQSDVLQICIKVHERCTWVEAQWERQRL